MLLNSSVTDFTTVESHTIFNIFDQGVISLQQLNTFYQYIPLVLPLGILALLTSTLNIWGNIRSGQDSYFTYFIGLSVGDTLCLVSVFCRCILSLFFHHTSQVYETYYRYMTTFVNTGFRRGAIVLNGVASSERFIKLVFPFKMSRNVLSRYPRYVILTVYVVSFLSHLPHAVEFVIEETEDNIWRIVPSNPRLDNPSLFIALRNACRVVFVYVPITYLIVINVALVVALRVHAAKQRNIRASRGARTNSMQVDFRARGVKHANQPELRPQGSDGRTVQTAVVVRSSRLVLIFSFTFLLFALPTTLSSTVSTFLPDYGMDTKNHYLWIMLTYLAEWVLYTTQPLLFTVNLMFNKQFRRSLFQKLHLARLNSLIVIKDNKCERNVG